MLASAVFGAAPRALAGVITLQQTVDLVKLSIEVVESNIDDIVHPDDAADAHAAVLRYAREVAFATAEVYARAAEVRGAWDARLEALVVDSVLRGEADEAVLSRASALGWSGHGAVCVVLGEAPGRRADTDVFEEVRRVARAAGQDALCATQGDRLVVLLGGTGHGDGPVGAGAAGPVRARPGRGGPGGRRPRARAPLRPRHARRPPRGRRAGPTRPARCAAPSCCPSGCWPATATPGATWSRRSTSRWRGARDTLVETLATYLATGSSLEATGRALYVHPNTVRYRLRQVADLTGFSPTEPREAFTLHIALVLGRQSGRHDSL